MLIISKHTLQDIRHVHQCNISHSTECTQSFPRDSAVWLTASWHCVLHSRRGTTERAPRAGSSLTLGVYTSGSVCSRITITTGILNLASYAWTVEWHTSPWKKAADEMNCFRWEFLVLCHQVIQRPQLSSIQSLQRNSEHNSATTAWSAFI